MWIVHDVVVDCVWAVSYSQAEPRGNISVQGVSPLFGGACVLLFGQYPTPGPPRSDIEELLVQGGARVFISLERFLAHIDQNNSSGGNNGSSSSANIATEKLVSSVFFLLFQLHIEDLILIMFRLLFARRWSSKTNLSSNCPLELSRSR